MSRPHGTPTRRVALTLEEADVAWLEAQAEVRGCTVAGLAAEIVVAQTRGTEAAEEEEAGVGLPREWWPIEVLIADRAWWRRWLPVLHRVLPWRPLPGGDEVVDDDGWLDLMTTLFPPVESASRGRRDWWMPDYPKWAKVAGDRLQEREPRGLQPERHRLWESVIRHVALALAALEASAQPGRSPYEAMRTRAELRSTWLAELQSGVLGGRHCDLGQPIAVR